MIRSYRRILSMAHKEISHIIRDPFTITMALGMPVIMVVIFGAAFEFNMDDIPIAVYDASKSSSSRQLVETFASSNHFKVNSSTGPKDAESKLESGKAFATMMIPPEFEKSLGTGLSTDVQILVDGSDSTAAGSILSYLPLIQSKAQEVLTKAQPRPIDIRTRFLYNPELNTNWFIVPGLGVVIMAILSVLLTSLTIAREWETGSMELLLSTPVRPIEIIIGKLIPYLFLGLGGVGFVYAVARMFFDIPFRGSHLLYLLACLLFVMTCMAQGLLISVIARSQQVAMQAAMISGMLPALYLSGFIYPIEHMPPIFQYITSILAPRWFMRISQNLFLKGSSLSELAQPFLALCIICAAIIALAAISFKKDVEP